MSRICTPTCGGLAAGMLLAIVPVATAGSTIQLLADRAETTALAWFDGGSPPDRQSQQGSSAAGLDLQANALQIDEVGRPSEVAARGRVATSGGAGVALYAGVEPAGMNVDGRGWVRTDLAWLLVVGPEAAGYSAGLWATGGSSGLRLYDASSGAVLADTGPYQGFGTSLSGQLLGGHTYRLEAWSLADASSGGDPHAGLEFRTDAPIAAATAPEPAAAALLLAGLAWPAWRQRCRQTWHAQR